MKDDTLIIGNGDVAEALKGVVRGGTTFFASGVSNSKEKNEREYQKEIYLLLAQNKSRHLVYFSSLCIFYSRNRYAKHKIEMERLIKQEFPYYTIIRLGNITWGNNPNTLLNNLRRKKQKGESFEIQDTYRFICDKEEFLYWINMIPSWNVEMNIPGRRMKVQQIVDELI